MTWLLVVAVVWVAIAVPGALVLGRAIRTAEERRSPGVDAQAWPGTDTAAGNFIATEHPPLDVETPCSGPSTAPFAPPRGPHRRPAVVRRPVTRDERNPAARDAGPR